MDNMKTLETLRKDIAVNFLTGMYFDKSERRKKYKARTMLPAGLKYALDAVNYAEEPRRMVQRWREGESVRVREQHAEVLDAYYKAGERLEGVIRWYYDRTPIQNRTLLHHENHEDAQSFYIEEYGNYSIEEVRQQLYAAFEDAHAIFADMLDKVGFSARFYRQKWSYGVAGCKTPRREKKTRTIEPGSSVGWNSSSEPSRYSCWNASDEIAILLEIPRSDVGIKVFHHENLSNGLTVELPTSEELSDLWETSDSFSEWKELVSEQIYENSETCQAHEAGRVHTV